MKKIILCYAIFAIALFADDIVKKDVDLDAILSKIDAISYAIKQKELEEQKLMQKNLQSQNNPPMEQPPRMTEEEKLQQELAKEEQELNIKQRKLELLQKKQDYYRRYEEIKKKSKEYLEKKTRQIIQNLKRELYILNKEKNYKLEIDRFMKIGSLKYAYVKNSKLEEAKKYLNTIDEKIDNIKKTIKRIQNAKDSNIDIWFQVINRVENQFQEEPKQLEAMNNQIQPPIPSQTPEMMISNNRYIKVKVGDIINNICIKSVNEDSVILSLKDK